MALVFTDTLRLTFTFLGTHAVTLLRVIWFPIFILVLSGVFFAQKMLPFLPALQSGNVTQVSEALTSSASFIAFGFGVPLVMSATAATGVLRFVVLGEGSESRAPIYMASGWAVLRVIAVTLILCAILILAATLISLAGLTIAAYVPGFEALLPLILVMSLAAVAARWLMAYPIAAAGGRIDLPAAWAMARPIYPRLIALVLVLILVTSVVDLAVGSALGPINPGDIKAVGIAFKERWILIALASFISNLFATASFFTLLGIIYRLRMRQSERPRPVGLAASQPDEPTP